MSTHAQRRILAAGFTGCLVTALILGGSSAAFAADGPFTIDGSIPDGGVTELADPSGNVKELGPLNSNTTKIGVIHDDVLPTLDLTNPNSQVDLRRAWLGTARDGADHDWLYFAWERDKNTGSGFIAFEFMKEDAPDACAYDTATADELIASCNPWANRTVGDFMILWDQQGGGTDLYLRTWTGPDDDHLTLGPLTPLDDAISAAAYGSGNFRGEAAIDLTAAVYGGVPQCLELANVIPSTVTGNSDTADYKDTVLTPGAELSNCKTSLTSAQKWVPNDSVTVSATAGGSLAGTVAFEFFSNGNCSGTAAWTQNVAVSGASPQTVSTTNTTAQTASGSFSWRVAYDSTNALQRDIPASCHETSSVTIANGGTVTSP